MADELEPSASPDDRPGRLYLGRPSDPDAGFPFFAEYPYFLWGEVNYDSVGNCSRPTDRQWSQLIVTDRQSGDSVDIQFVTTSEGAFFLEISGSRPQDVWLAAYLTSLRSGCDILDLRPANAGVVSSETILEWTGDVTKRLQAANRIREMFLDPRLTPFDSKSWWGGWKWVGRFSTDWTSGLRVIMDAVQSGQADRDVIEWMRRENPKPFHREGWNYALRVLSATPTSSPAVASKALPYFLRADAPSKPIRRAWWNFWQR